MSAFGGKADIAIIRKASPEQVTFPVDDLPFARM
jgi:hypothetical protein